MKHFLFHCFVYASVIEEVPVYCHDFFLGKEYNSLMLLLLLATKAQGCYICLQCHGEQ